MRIFLTGGTGFVGSYFLNAAHAAGHEVIALRRSRSVRPRVALDRAPEWLTKSMDKVTERDMRGCDALVHLAAAGVSPQAASWNDLTKWNVYAPFRLCEMAISASVRRIVLSGSITEYGHSADRYRFVPPAATLLPTFPYAASKAASFVLAYSLAVERNAELYYGRISAAYGPGQHIKNIWPALRDAALAGRDFRMTPGKQIRDFIRVDRVAAIFVDALTRKDIRPGRPVVENVGSGVPEVLSAWAERWWRHFGAKGRLRIGAMPYRENEVMRYVPAVSARIRRLAEVPDGTAGTPRPRT
jgi:UDP-glucose 4-epimerase